MGSNTNDKIVVTDNVSTTPYLFRETEGKQQPLGFRKGLSIASLNVNSLQLHFDEIQCMTNELGIHVLALNETKLNPHVPKISLLLRGIRLSVKIGQVMVVELQFILETPSDIICEKTFL